MVCGALTERSRTVKSSPVQVSGEAADADQRNDEKSV